MRTEAATGATLSATAVSLGTADTFAYFNIHGLLGSKTIDAAGTSAKDIAEAVNIQFDNTGVSAKASTNMKIQAKGTSAGSATLSIGLKGKNTTVRTISAGITLGTAVGGSDLTGLSNAINAYSAELEL